MYQVPGLPVAGRGVNIFVLPVICIIFIVGLISIGPISQDPAYHLFADHRTLFGLVNFWNVASNLPFVLVGLIGLYHCAALQDNPYLSENRMACGLFFAGVFLAGLSSGAYHYQPDNISLFWDRLSMALCFMAFLDIIVGTFIGRKPARILLVPLVIFGLFSVAYWIITEKQGAGDLRPYAIVQFLPFLVVPVIIFSSTSEHIKRFDIMVIGFLYIVAKLFEFCDTSLYQLISVSGHSLKHFAAALSAYWVLRIITRCRQNTSGIINKVISGG